MKAGVSLIICTSQALRFNKLAFIHYLEKKIYISSKKLALKV